MKHAAAWRDFQAYLRFCDPGGLFGVTIPYDSLGADAFAVFVAAENGQELPCREPLTLAMALSGKAQLNFQIGEWADGINDGLFIADEFSKSYPWLPDWVWAALRKRSRPRFGWSVKQFA